MVVSNILKAARNLVTGKSTTRLRAFYVPRYPPTKFLLPGQKRVAIKCILCGYPRTGTHWIRNVIRRSTGIETYSVPIRKPIQFHENGIMVKIHARNKTIARAKALWLLPVHRFEGRYIYTYRDPRDAILSLYEKFKHAKNRPDLTPEEFLVEQDPIGQYRWEISSWLMRKHDNVLLVRFEDVKLTPNPEFEKIFRFLDLDAQVAQTSINEPVAQVGKTVRSRRTAYSWKTAPVTYQRSIEIINSRLETEIRTLGYDMP